MIIVIQENANENVVCQNELTACIGKGIILTMYHVITQ